MQGVARVDDIFDNQHIAPFDCAAQVFEDTHFSAAFHAIAIAGGFEEIDLDREVKFAHQIGDKHERSAQQPHHCQLFGTGEFALDFAAKGFDPRGDCLGRDHFIDDIRSRRHGFYLEKGGDRIS